jgi:hypothetical protein
MGVVNCVTSTIVSYLLLTLVIERLDNKGIE